MFIKNILTTRNQWLITKNIRYFASVTPNELKNGMFIIYNGHDCEVKGSRPVKQGRGAASVAVDFYDLVDKKPVSCKLHQGLKLEKLEVQRKNVQMIEMDKEKKSMTALDANFEETMIPLAALDGDSVDIKNLELGASLVVYASQDRVIKVTAGASPPKSPRS